MEMSSKSWELLERSAAPASLNAAKQLPACPHHMYQHERKRSYTSHGLWPLPAAQPRGRRSSS
jgi:hypothetical protein